MAKMNLSDSLLLWINAETTIGFVILNGKFNPKNVLGAEFKKLNEEGYQMEGTETNLMIPFNSSIKYDKKLVDMAKQIIELMGYAPKLYAPKEGDIPLVVHFSGDSSHPPKVMVIAPRVTNG